MASGIKYFGSGWISNFSHYFTIEQQNSFCISCPDVLAQIDVNAAMF
jgi:hypothetical protein